MRSQRMPRIVLFILVTSWLLAACGSSAAPTPVTPVAQVAATDTRPASPATPSRCGDGVCDQAEQDNPSLCPQDCQATAPPTEEPPTPTALPPSPTPVLDTPAPEPPPSGAAGRCGDGTCDEAEQKDPTLCPQDCPEKEPPPTTPSPGTADYEPPINVYLVLHIDPLGDQESPTFKPEQGMYTRTRSEIDWLAEEAARHGLHFTALYNGWYPQWALKEGDTSQFRALLDAGHEIGSHAHQISYDASTDTWVKHVEELSLFGHPNYDPALARQCWDDADRYMDSVVTQIGVAGQNQIMCSTALRLSDEDEMMAEFGFAIAAGNRLEKGINYFGHVVWNPWRAATSDEPGHELAEDLTSGYVTFNHLAQIGGGGSIGMPSQAHGQDLTVPQLQRRFLMLYAEWLARERTGAEDRVWAFGFVYHPNYGDLYNAELGEFLSWLDANFVGQTSPYGHTIAHYATIGEITQEFTAWEVAHPGASSFHYVRGDPYPYTYATLVSKLEGAAYEARVDLSEGVSGFRLAKEGQPIYLLWSDAGEQVLDLSSQLSGQVQVTDTAGVSSVQDATALTLDQEPLLVEPLD